MWVGLRGAGRWGGCLDGCVGGGGAGAGGGRICQACLRGSKSLATAISKSHIINTIREKCEWEQTQNPRAGTM